MNTPLRLSRHVRGLTLIETSVCLAITAIVVGAAAPSFESMRERRHLEGAVAQFETDLQLARAAAVARGRTVRIDFHEAAGCYVVHTGGSQDCRCDAAPAPVCRAGAEPLKVALLMVMPVPTR